VHDFEAWLIHDAVRVEVGVGWEACCRYVFGAGGVGVAAAFGVGVNVQLDLADAAVELLGERLVLIIEAFEGFGVVGLPELALAGGDAGVVAVVGAYDLDMVELEGVGLAWEAVARAVVMTRVERVRSM
jgi:hypothetical protein